MSEITPSLSFYKQHTSFSIMSSVSAMLSSSKDILNLLIFYHIQTHHDFLFHAPVNEHFSDFSVLAFAKAAMKNALISLPGCDVISFGYMPRIIVSGSPCNSIFKKFLLI